MKNYLKGLLSGIVIMAIIAAIPVFGDNISVAFNQVRVNVFGVDQIQWGDNLTLADGTSVPSSILYQGTTYLPMRQLGDLLNMRICWNGDSRTVSATKYPLQTSYIITTRADANGNVWTYSVCLSADKIYYLDVKDEKRGYERVYRINGYDGSGVNSPALRVTDDGIYFARITYDMTPRITGNYICSVYHIPFLSDADSQDGIDLADNIMVNINPNIIFDGDYLYYINQIPNVHSLQSELCALNYVTGEKATYDDFFYQTADIGNLTLSNNSDETVLYFSYQGSGGDWENGQYQITVNKTGGLSFGTPQLIAAD